MRLLVVWCLMDVDPRLLRYFLAVARDLHFGRAAAKLYLSQPALSEGIKKLETELGVALFIRGSRRVELTESGRVLLAQAPVVLSQLDRTIAFVRSTARRGGNSFRIGYSPFVDLARVWAVRTYLQRAEPDLSIEFISSKTTEQISLLLRNEIQAGILVGPVDEQGLILESVFREKFMVGLPKGHQLARNRGIRLRDLETESIIWIPRSFHPAFYDRFLSLCGAREYRPRITHEVTTVSECLQLIKKGEGITFMTRSAQPIPVPGVVFHELRDENFFVETLVATRSDASAEFLKRFGEIVRTEFGRTTIKA